MVVLFNETIGGSSDEFAIARVIQNKAVIFVFSEVELVGFYEGLDRFRKRHGDAGQVLMSISLNVSNSGVSLIILQGPSIMFLMDSIPGIHLSQKKSIFVPLKAIHL